MRKLKVPKAVILMGPPGSGKGTQAAMVATKYSLPQISTGDILREEVSRGTRLGLSVKRVMESGRLVADEVMAQIIRKRIAEPDCASGFILDGFPRTERQAEILDKMLAEHRAQLVVINLKVDEETIKKRIVGRRSCPNCGRVYNVYLNPSPSGDECENCGAKLVQRSDDREEVLAERLAVYREQTEPLVSYYKGSKGFHEVDGRRQVEQIFEEICKIIEGTCAQV